MKIILPIFFFFFFTSNVSAQKIHSSRSYKGTVTDSATSKPLHNATLTIFRASDTTLIQFAFTTINGNYNFVVTNILDSLLVVVSMLGYEDKYWHIKEIDKGSWYYDSKNFILASIPYELNAVRIRKSAITIKNDTMEIDAKRFKVLPGSDVAQLFKKIPGFEISAKGELTVDGIKISKITVDGSDFFGNNPGLVSKNLNADMVETIQVYEPKDESGAPANTENQEKIINLKLKSDKKKGIFGDVLAGYGTDKRYESGLRLNHFKEDKKISFITNYNNINESGFDFGFNNWNNTYFENANGAEENWYSYYERDGNLNNKLNSAFTFFNEYSRKRKLSINLSYNNNHFFSINNEINFLALSQSSNRQEKDSQYNSGKVQNVRARIDFNQTIDSTKYFSTMFKIFGEQGKRNNINFNSISFNDTLVNKGENIVENENFERNIETGFNWTHRLRKNRKYYYNLSSNVKYSENEIQINQFSNVLTDTFNNFNNQNNNNLNWVSKFSIGTPLTKKWSFRLVTDNVLKLGGFKQEVLNALDFRKRDFNQIYTSKIDSLSIQFQNKTRQISINPQIIYYFNKSYFYIGLTALNYEIKSVQNRNTQIKPISFNHFMPNLYYSKWGDKLYASISLSRNINYPTINDLMPLVNLNNNLNRQIGNVELEPTINNVFYGYISKRKFYFLDRIFIRTDVRQSDNYKVYLNEFTEDGKIVSKPVNSTGYYSIDNYLSFEKKFLKKLNADYSFSHDYSQQPFYVNLIKGYSNSNTFRNQIDLEFIFSDILEMSLNSSVKNTNSKNSQNSQLDFNQVTYSSGIDFRFNLNDRTEISSDFYMDFLKNIPNIGKNLYIWNLYFQQNISKKNNLSFKITCYDILKQNTNLSRFVSNSYVTIRRENTLQQFFLFSLVYNINSKNKNSGEEFAN